MKILQKKGLCNLDLKTILVFLRIITNKLNKVSKYEQLCNLKFFSYSKGKEILLARQKKKN